MSERLVDSIDVDGREGTLTILKGWADISFILKVAIPSQTQWRTVLPQILSAKTITFSNDSGVHFRVKQVKASGLTQLLSHLWESELTFVCAPFRYLNNVAILNRTSSGIVTNNGGIYSLPKIKVYGTGTRTLTINGKPIVLNLLQSYLIIDSELKECYYGDTAQNNCMNGEFPIFNVGNNQVTLGTGITKLEIEPRWRYV
jgi:phage-related protein